MAYIHEYGKNKAEDVLIPSGYNSQGGVYGSSNRVFMLEWVWRINQSWVRELWPTSPGRERRRIPTIYISIFFTFSLNADKENDSQSVGGNMVLLVYIASIYLQISASSYKEDFFSYVKVVTNL